MSKKYFNATYNEWMDRLEDSMRKKYVCWYRAYAGIASVKMLKNGTHIPAPIDSDDHLNL